MQWSIATPQMHFMNPLEFQLRSERTASGLNPCQCWGGVVTSCLEVWRRATTPSSISSPKDVEGSSSTFAPHSFLTITRIPEPCPWPHGSFGGVIHVGHQPRPRGPLDVASRHYICVSPLGDI
jgi:hypothetical protein